MRKVWGLYSTYVDPYNSSELIELFENEEQANQVRDMLVGKPVNRYRISFWRDDPEEPEFSDLHVIERIVR